MNLQGASLFDLDFFEPLPIQFEVSNAPLTSDAGLLPLRQFDERIGLTKQFAAVLNDPRDPELIDHSFLDMSRVRIFGMRNVAYSVSSISIVVCVGTAVLIVASTGV